MSNDELQAHVTSHKVTATLHPKVGIKVIVVSERMLMHATYIHMHWGAGQVVFMILAGVPHCMWYTLSF